MTGWRWRELEGRTQYMDCYELGMRLEAGFGEEEGEVMTSSLACVANIVFPGKAFGSWG